MGYSYNWFTALTNIEGILTGVGHIKYSYDITCIGQQLLVAMLAIRPRPSTSF